MKFIHRTTLLMTSRAALEEIENTFNTSAAAAAAAPTKAPMTTARRSCTDLRYKMTESEVCNSVTGQAQTSSCLRVVPLARPSSAPLSCVLINSFANRKWTRVENKTALTLHLWMFATHQMFTQSHQCRRLRFESITHRNRQFLVTS